MVIVHLSTKVAEGAVNSRSYCNKTQLNNQIVEVKIYEFVYIVCTYVYIQVHEMVSFSTRSLMK